VSTRASRSSLAFYGIGAISPAVKGNLYVLLGILLPAIALWIFSKYTITRAVHERNLAELGYSPQPDAEA
jgi:hypothetical protein